MDGGAWWAAVYGVVQSRTRLKRLSSSQQQQQQQVSYKWGSKDTVDIWGSQAWVFVPALITLAQASCGCFLSANHTIVSSGNLC